VCPSPDPLHHTPRHHPPAACGADPFADVRGLKADLERAIKEGLEEEVLGVLGKLGKVGGGRGVAAVLKPQRPRGTSFLRGAPVVSCPGGRDKLATCGALCVQVKVSLAMLKDTGIVDAVKAAKEKVKWVSSLCVSCQSQQACVRAVCVGHARMGMHTRFTVQQVVVPLGGIPCLHVRVYVCLCVGILSSGRRRSRLPRAPWCPPGNGSWQRQRPMGPPLRPQACSPPTQLAPPLRVSCPPVAGLAPAPVPCL
jgi:hypothetical protein